LAYVVIAPSAAGISDPDSRTLPPRGANQVPGEFGIELVTEKFRFLKTAKLWPGGSSAGTDRAISPFLDDADEWFG